MPDDTLSLGVASEDEKERGTSMSFHREVLSSSSGYSGWLWLRTSDDKGFPRYISPDDFLRLRDWLNSFKDE